MLLTGALIHVVDLMSDTLSQSGFTFIISGEGEAWHGLQAVGAAHHQRAGAPLRLGGAGGGPRAQAANRQRPVQPVN